MGRNARGLGGIMLRFYDPATGRTLTYQIANVCVESSPVQAVAGASIMKLSRLTPRPTAVLGTRIS
jgi:hypothetical protein